jgi:hypothetical protein
MRTKVWFIKEVHNKIQINKNIDNKRCKTNNQKNDFELKFDLWWIIIWNDFEIVIVMIAKIPILHKLVLRKHRNWNLKINMEVGRDCLHYELKWKIMWWTFALFKHL